MSEQVNIPIRIGISTCLLGEKVRFDGGHKRDRYLDDVLGKYFEWVPVCPEVEVGMGIPREAVRLVRNDDRVQMLGVKTQTDWTSAIAEYSNLKVKALHEYCLSGYIFKSDSPSCGMERVRVYSNSGMPAKNGRGLFADAFMAKYPLIPVEEEGRLNDPKLRENFIERVFCFYRLLQLIEHRFSVGELVEFHTVSKYLMLAHSTKHYRQLGRLVANAKGMPHARLRDEYAELYMDGLKIHATTKTNTNVLQHILGYLREHISTEERNDILATIEDYRKGLVPLVVPMTLIRHYINKHNIEYIKKQLYLNPHPKELMLRNHV
jgi:uncharacterized protein YbgA (DUF1722 family)/uncharacterized protein YbbK (DUF523 family)